MGDGIGARFQEETKYRRGGLPRRPASVSRPAPFKPYPSSQRVDLPPAGEAPAASLWQVLKVRRSIRDYGPAGLTREELSRLLWAAQGVTSLPGGFPLRSAPSAGALYPVETYLSVQKVEGIQAGLYHYSVLARGLELIASGDFGEAMAAAALDQDFLGSAGAVFIWTALFARSAWKYGERTYRYVYLDAGHIAQNVALAAAALGLGSCQVAALYDEEVNALLGVDGQAESVVYMTSVGRPRR
jgi:SagB-type dehydrogenase family enzyme